MMNNRVIILFCIIKFPNHHFSRVSFTEFYTAKTKEMKLSPHLKFNITYIIALLHILLFTYAATSKILDFENFQIQLGQSPLLSSFAGAVSYGVIIVELLLVILLISKKTRPIALYGSLLLMTMFTTYIYIILNYSSFVPCSCGGILEKLGWTEHMIFNSFFILLALIAIIINATTKFVYGFVPIHVIGGVSIVTTLFLMSEDIMQHRNNFVRRFPDKVHKVYDTDLNFNSYYIAGASKGKIYLGNHTAPLLLTEIDTTLKTKKEIVVHLDNMKLPFRSLELRVQPNYFFAVDATVPRVFRGKTGYWRASTISASGKPFANPVIIDSNTVAFRTHNTKTESVLGMRIFNKKDSSWVNPALLQKQIDGIFDVDGTLMFDNETNKIVYLYRYRNQYIVTDSRLNLIIRGKTIDTIAKAQIKVAYNKDRNETKLAAPPLSVNKSGALNRGLLFVNSALIGKFEDAKMWNQASVIDIYDINKNTYLESFYIYNIDRNKMNSFFVYKHNFYALIGTQLVRYKLSKKIVNSFSKPHH